ncbi:MAG: TolB family protein [Flavisolibacter sp.]
MLQRNSYLAIASITAFFSILCSNSEMPERINSIPQKKDSLVQPLAVIAYSRNSSEIRLIDSNGKNDRMIWTHPDAKGLLGLYDLAWRPDGKELAFSSAHESLFSLYDADIYGIRPDGSGFRKITHPPDHNDFGRYKKGSVTLTIRNNQYSFQQSQASAGVFFVNVIGADQPQQITVAPGGSKTIVFKTVADFGKHAQPIVAFYGKFRWFMPGTDVVAGQNIKAPDLLISGNGIEYYGAFRPVWKQDGSKISYRTGSCLVETSTAFPADADISFNPLFAGKNPMGSCVWDWGPTTALSKQVIYSENSNSEGSGIYIMKEGGIHNPASRLTFFSNIQYQILYDLKWLPDGSGFLYSTVNLFRESGNIFLYEMKSKKTRQLTQLKKEFAKKFSVSPSGKWVVYERAKAHEDDKEVDLWMIKIDGTSDHLLVKNGLNPSWSR